MTTTTHSDAGRLNPDASASALELEPLEVPRTAQPSTLIGRWLEAGRPLDESHEHGHEHPWYLVLWLTGVDYFSTLGYQPGIALLAAGVLSPIATLILVAVTLTCALPVYAQVASRSYAGQGSIALLEHLLTGWRSKILVLLLLGFALTDFIITMTLSAADAAQHAVENPFLHPYLADHALGVTILLLAILAVVFLRGFAEAISVAAAIAIPFLLLNVVVLARGIVEIVRHPELFAGWHAVVRAHGDWSSIALVSALVFPKLALGLSGFETGVSVMPLVRGDGDRPGDAYPAGRVRATRNLLVSAAVIMSVMLLVSSMVTALLVPPAAYAEHGEAAGRAIAYLAHHLLGSAFGSLYDVVTILILAFAGASAMAGLLNLIPRYLPRFGMAPRWTVHARPLVLLLFGVTLAVTIVFDANVEAQAGAYATGVLVLMLSAAVAAALAFWQESTASAPAVALRRRMMSVFFWIVSAVFAYTLIDNVVTRPDGVIIASLFIAAILVFGGVSRYRRAHELRAARTTFADAESAELWKEIEGRKVNLAPMRSATPADRERKRGEIRTHYMITGPLAFLNVDLVDDRSEFLATLRLQIRRDGTDFVIAVSGAVAIANTVAYVSELVDPLRIFLSLTRKNLMTQSLSYVFWGEGETGLKVYTILLRYWAWTPEEDVRPLIFLMSE